MKENQLFKLTDGLAVEAYAKVNFTLEVLGKREDGYHDLRSLVVPVSLSDTITLTNAEKTGLEISAEDPIIDLSKMGVPENNLAVRAAELMREVCGIKESVHIKIKKRIPLGGGLGGGSADAAAVINGLNELWNLGLEKRALAELGAQIGSDVPALVLGGPVMMEGRGERVRSFECGEWGTESCGKRYWLVLVNPGVFCSTPQIFKSLKGICEDRPEILRDMRSAISKQNEELVAKALQNDLSDAAFDAYPQVANAAKALKDAGALGVLMSGSGASVFGLARDSAHAQQVQALLKDFNWARTVQTCCL